jgi:hypothetical protein
VNGSGVTVTAFAKLSFPGAVADTISSWSAPVVAVISSTLPIWIR